MLQKLLNKKEVLDIVLASGETSGEYSSYRDGTHYKDNSFFAEDDHRISLNLFIDDFESTRNLAKEAHVVCYLLDSC